MNLLEFQQQPWIQAAETGPQVLTEYKLAPKKLNKQKEKSNQSKMGAVGSLSKLLETGFGTSQSIPLIIQEVGPAKKRQSTHFFLSSQQL